MNKNIAKTVDVQTWDGLDPIPLRHSRKRSEEVITTTKAEVYQVMICAALGGATLGAGIALLFVL